jgi:hypothetical protein
MLLASAIHLYFLLLLIERKTSRTRVLLHGLAGGLILMSCLYFIFPPSDSMMKLDFWVGMWNLKHVKAIVLAPIRSLAPIPSWWNYHFWNTQFLVEAQANNGLLHFLTAALSLALFGIAILVLSANRKCLILFGANALLAFCYFVLFPSVEARYVGFIYIGLLAAYWLYCSETPVTGRTLWLMNALLFLQCIAAAIAVPKDIRYPFSNAYRINELLKEVPGNEEVVTDYWTINPLSTFADKPFYCLDLGRKISFLKWDGELQRQSLAPTPYYTGITSLFQMKGLSQVAMISQESPPEIMKADPKIMNFFNFKLIDKREGAIAWGSNLYLYEIGQR